MNLAHPSIVRSALPAVTIRRVAQQILLGLAVIGLSVLWLRVPDASIVYILASALLGLAVIVIAGVGQSFIFLKICNRPIGGRRLLRGTVLLICGALVWLAWCALLSRLHTDDSLIAGYLNSKSPHRLRPYFSFEHILLWLGWIWLALLTIGAGAVDALVFTMMAGVHPIRAAKRAVRSLTYWCVLLPGSFAVSALTIFLLNWTPGHGLGLELLSLILRLASVVVISSVFVIMLLSILAVCVVRSDGDHDSPAGTPEESQPLTSDSP